MTQTSRGALLTVAVSERDHASGLPDAPVTLVEYGDFECPFCGMAYPDIKRIQSRLGDQLLSCTGTFRARSIRMRALPLRQPKPPRRNNHSTSGECTTSSLRTSGRSTIPVC